MFARIYQPAASAMTSGRANASEWVLEFVSRQPTIIDPLTGNARSVDTRQQIELQFPTLEEAIAYAKSNNIPHQVQARQKMKRIPRSYAENFDYDRKLPWTH
ncbi:NADH dehydrogenase ubiquinone Fe-S protein 4 [Litorimonas sp. RW-G-Af-16]|uniref:NADH dehydrogenase ubiquinone Fe-S protein 4 n=1 Tax=Litorimonas sp. RW-G-Af-16 TaxID=3241168 RepID=UPI00390CC94B